MKKEKKTVFYTDMQTEFGNSLEAKFRKILKKSSFFETIREGELVALKVHVGERENLAYLNPNYARIVAEEVKARGAHPFCTDTNTLYSGGRQNGVVHSLTAVQHGFTYATVGAPFIPADGVRGLDYREVEVPGKRFDKVKIAGGIAQADKIVLLSHFKGHIEAGFAGSIKNLSMGCASISGKREQHAETKPEVNTGKCIGCKQCYRACPVGAVEMKNKKARIDYNICIGCGQCVAACNYEAMEAGSSSDLAVFIEKVSEYAYGISSYFGENAFYFNFAVNITPDCDCWPANDVPIVEDVGILASENPFALDRASLDLVSASKPLSSSRYREKISGTHSNIFREVWDESPSDTSFKYLQKQFGVTSDYELRRIR